jgi:hypothetical protein
VVVVACSVCNVSDVILFLNLGIMMSLCEV